MPKALFARLLAGHLVCINGADEGTHMEELDALLKIFIEIQGWLLLTFFIYLHNQLNSYNSIMVQMSEKRDSSNRQ